MKSDSKFAITTIHIIKEIQKSRMNLRLKQSA